jgi:hypothetical protein
MTKTMRIKKGIIILVALLATKILLDLGFKIRYSNDNIYDISDFNINDSIYVESGSIYFGKNIRGNIEAIIFPSRVSISNHSADIDYIYFRLFPDWYQTELQPLISKANTESHEMLLSKAKEIHENNFRSYMHFNNYPIVRKDYIPFIIKLKEQEDKVRYTKYL